MWLCLSRSLLTAGIKLLSLHECSGKSQTLDTHPSPCPCWQSHSQSVVGLGELEGCSNPDRCMVRKGLRVSVSSAVSRGRGRCDESPAHLPGAESCSVNVSRAGCRSLRMDLCHSPRAAGSRQSALHGAALIPACQGLVNEELCSLPFERSRHRACACRGSFTG